MLLKIFWNFRNSSRKRSTRKQPFSGVPQDRCPEKNRKLHMEAPVRESLFKKVSRNKETPAQVFSCGFCEAFKNFAKPFYRAPPVQMEFVFKKVLRLGVHKKVFEWLVAKEFSSNSKHYLRFSCISHFLFLHFLCKLFSLLIKILNTSAWKIYIQSNYQEVDIKRCFCRFVGEIFRYERWFMK